MSESEPDGCGRGPAPRPSGGPCWVDVHRGVHIRAYLHRTQLAEYEPGKAFHDLAETPSVEVRTKQHRPIRGYTPVRSSRDNRVDVATLRSAVAKSREHAGVLVVQKVSLLMRRLLRMHQHLGRRGIRS